MVLPLSQGADHRGAVGFYNGFVGRPRLRPEDCRIPILPAVGLGVPGVVGLLVFWLRLFV